MHLEHDDDMIRLELKVLNKAIVFYIGNRPNLLSFGLTNETVDNYFVPFIDYDNIYYDTVLKDLRHIQAVFSLGPLILITSQQQKDANGFVYGNYHVIGLDKLTYQEHLEMLKHTRCDRNFISAPTFYKGRHWVLRFSEKFYTKNGKVKRKKPIFKEIVYNKPPFERKASYGHYLALRKLFNIPRLDLNFDKFTHTDMIQYQAR